VKAAKNILSAAGHAVPACGDFGVTRSVKQELPGPREAVPVQLAFERLESPGFSRGEEVNYPEMEKIPRWNREVVITEKVDGTNGLIGVVHIDSPESAAIGHQKYALGYSPFIEEEYVVFAGSKSRWLTLGEDNFGFARFVQERVADIVFLLGPGVHRGEFYGKGIQRGYGLDHRRFALFNVNKWHGKELPPEFDVVPVLAAYDRPTNFSYELEKLAVNGSKIAPGFDRPEGIVIYHTAGNALFKATILKDDQPKGK